MFREMTQAKTMCLGVRVLRSTHLHCIQLYVAQTWPKSQADSMGRLPTDDMVNTVQPFMTTPMLAYEFPTVGMIVLWPMPLFGKW